MRLTLPKIAELIAATGQYPRDESMQGYSIDSRTVRSGELFFAVKASGWMGMTLWLGLWRKELRRPSYEEISWSAVPEGPIAGGRRHAGRAPEFGHRGEKALGRPLIGVTGSAGKTTTKDAIAHVLGSRFRVLKSEGNFNNHFGLPLMLLKLEPDHDVAVIEMGMSHAGEIRALAKIAQPEVGW